MSRIFINNVNTYLGQALLEEFRNDDTVEDNPNAIIATLDPNDPTPRPNGIKKVLNVRVHTEAKTEAVQKIHFGL